MKQNYAMVIGNCIYDSLLDLFSYVEQIISYVAWGVSTGSQPYSVTNGVETVYFFRCR